MLKNTSYKYNSYVVNQTWNHFVVSISKKFLLESEWFFFIQPQTRCLKHCKDKIETINWVTDYIKCLGIYFGHNKAECKKLNIEKQLLKSEKIINSWKKRNIAMVGRIMIVKSLIIPNITYVASVTNIVCNVCISC